MKGYFDDLPFNYFDDIITRARNFSSFKEEDIIMTKITCFYDKQKMKLIDAPLLFQIYSQECTREIFEEFMSPLVCLIQVATINNINYQQKNSFSSKTTSY